MFLEFDEENRVVTFLLYFSCITGVHPLRVCAQPLWIVTSLEYISYNKVYVQINTIKSICSFYNFLTGENNFHAIM